ALRLGPLAPLAVRLVELTEPGVRLERVGRRGVTLDGAAAEFNDPQRLGGLSLFPVVAHEGVGDREYFDRLASPGLGAAGFEVAAQGSDDRIFLGRGEPRLAVFAHDAEQGEPGPRLVFLPGEREEGVAHMTETLQVSHRKGEPEATDGAVQGSGGRFG